MSVHLHTAGDKLIDRYRVIRYVNEGGMQQVFLAEDSVFHREVALKVPKNPSAEKRFARSAQVSARIVHSNVAATLDYFEQGGKSYLVEEFIEGSTISERMEKEFAYFDPHLAAHVIHHLAKGVAASHRAGVFHRDLKPGNIMVSSDPGLSSVKITDFGIAKMAEEEIADAFKDNDSITGSQTVMGALPYMAPEMVLDPRTATLPADIWALGAMLYQMISGKHPFGQGLKAVPTIVEAKLPSEPMLFNIKDQFRQLTHDLWEIVESCLQKEATKRPSADTLVEKCAQLCYSIAGRRTGKIGVYGGQGRGKWGFIESDDGSSVFFHRDSFYGEQIVRGTRVNFASFSGAPQGRAFPVLPIK